MRKHVVEIDPCTHPQFSIHGCLDALKNDFQALILPGILRQMKWHDKNAEKAILIVEIVLYSDYDVIHDCPLKTSWIVKNTVLVF